MIDILIIVVFFSLLNLFLPMIFSLHKVPFKDFTYIGGDVSGKTELSKRLALSADNLKETLPLFLALSILSIQLGVDNSLPMHVWLFSRIIYLLGSVFNVYTIPLIRPLVWLPSIGAIAWMACNLV
ncbi:MAG: MAPEG family protein [Gammaproteobacteria bacterium]|tara:strand:- start:230 stop:607 length:378 start_codon:yes stop_codon:yes gene_type:complete